MAGLSAGSGREVVIEGRFNGPPALGNGGYSCGLVAGALSGAVEVNLRRPVPVDRPLRLTVPETHVAHLHEGDTLIAEARGTSLELDLPPAPGWEDAVQAAANYPGFTHHPFPTCFGCGVQREEGDGLRIFSGPRNDAEGFAAPWVPHAALAGPDGTLPAPVVWTALDCPSGWAATPLLHSDRFPAGSTMVTAKLSAHLDAPVHAGRRYTTLGWITGIEGREITTGTALYDGDGRPVAWGAALWVALPPRD